MSNEPLNYTEQATFEEALNEYEKRKKEMLLSYIMHNAHAATSLQSTIVGESPKTLTMKIGSLKC